MKRGLLSILLITSFCQIFAKIYTSQNVPKGEIAEPLSKLYTDANVIIVGGGTSGSHLAYLLGTGDCPLKVLVLSEGNQVTYHEEALLPGNENEAYYNVHYEQSFLPIDKSLFSNNQFQAQLNRIYGGAERLSHFAIEKGPKELYKRRMFDALGGPSGWEPEIIWEEIDSFLTFIGPNISNNHYPNNGRIKAVESKVSKFQDSWLKACANATNYPINMDFNTINGSYNTCGGEPSNVRQDFSRSTAENEYLIPEIESGNQNIDLVYDTIVTQILFENKNNIQTAVGVKGRFRNQEFEVYLAPSSSTCLSCKSKCAKFQKKYRDIILTTGSIITPQLLMVSGIGRREVIENLNIPLVKDLRHVGQHLQDVASTHALYITNASRADIGYYNATPSPIVQSRPGMFDNAKNLFLLATPLDFGFARVLFAIVFQIEQLIEGNLTITHPDIHYQPSVYYNWDQRTLQDMAEGIKLFRKIVFEGGMAKEWSMTESEPGQNINTDADLRNFAKKYLQGVNHISSTCRMALNETDGVVGLDFKVFGVSQLRLCSMAVNRYAPGAGGQVWAWLLAKKLHQRILAEMI